MSYLQVHHFLPYLVLDLGLPKSSLISIRCYYQTLDARRNTSKQAIYALQSEQSPTRTKVMTILVLIMIFEVTHIHPYENEIFETKELLTNIKIASKLQESTAIRHFDALRIHQNKQYMLYRAKKVPLEPKL